MNKICVIERKNETLTLGEAVKPYYDHAGITIYHARCEEVIPYLEGIDAVVSDPPYGVSNDCDYTRFTNGLSQHRNFDSPIVGDDQVFDPSPFLDYPHVTLWGANYYASLLPVGTWLVWLKKRPNQLGSFLSDCELAWEKGGKGVYCYQHVWHGFDRQSEKGKTLHPTQKPVSLMQWCIQRHKLTTQSLILDPYMGSGATLCAAKKLGMRAIGIDVREDYCELTAERLSQEVMF